MTKRRVITQPQLAAPLDQRLYWPGPSDADLRDGCRDAMQKGLGGVVTLPERLEVASKVLGGSSVGLGTAINWHGRDTDRLDRHRQSG